jgi:cytochrome b
MASDSRLVWDLPLRAFHWLLALSILGSWLTAEVKLPFLPDPWALHYQLGYFTLGLLCFRIIWGFVGPKHARFASFLPGPRKLWRYAKGLFAGKSDESVGHSPLGALAVIGLLAAVSLQAVTGLFTGDEDDFRWGPYYSVLNLSWIHHRSFYLVLLPLIGLHVAAVAFYWAVKKQNLLGPMLTGRKPAALVPASEAIAGSAPIRALIVICACAALVCALVFGAPTTAAS